jgi:hypothetical protein
MQQQLLGTWVNPICSAVAECGGLCMIYFSITIGAADARNTPCRRCEIVLLAHTRNADLLCEQSNRAADLPFCFYIHRGALRTPADIRQNEIFNEQHWILRMVFSAVGIFSGILFEINKFLCVKFFESNWVLHHSIKKITMLPSKR